MAKAAASSADLSQEMIEIAGLVLSAFSISTCQSPLLVSKVEMIAALLREQLY